jgi:geranylgeranyl diphosphate synthase type II
MSNFDLFQDAQEPSDSKIEPVLSQLRSEIDAGLMASTSASYPENLYIPMKYFLELGGKRLRPLLVLLSCRAVCGAHKQALPAAVAVELLHNFTLVHDDIMDQDSLRRGKSTVHTRWNEAVAILTGDGLIGLAYRIMLKTPPETLPRVLDIFTEGVIKVCEGQAIDKDFEDRERVTLDEYFNMIEKKTGELIAISTELGGIIGKGDEEQVFALKQFGHSIGRAFQIQDDILDLTSTESVLGKDLGSDLARGKKTYAIVKLQEKASHQDWNYIRQVLKARKIDPPTLNRVIRILKESGVLDEADMQIRTDIQNARNSLLKISTGDWANELLELSQLILNRRH